MHKRTQKQINTLKVLFYFYVILIKRVKVGLSKTAKIKNPVKNMSNTFKQTVAG